MAAQSEIQVEQAPAPGAMDSEPPRVATRLMKLVISLAFYAATESRRALIRILGKPSPPSAVVIYYHHVLGEHREKFFRQLDHLLRWTQPMPADLRGPLAPNVRYSIVTADDGWKSFADNAVPELKRRNIPVTMFAISDRLGQSIDGIAFDRLLTADELRALATGVVSIGSHTATHTRMTTLTEQDALRELSESREDLRTITGREVAMFCFPYGAYSDDLISICRATGYQRIFTCMPTLANEAEFVLGRVRVDPTDLPIEFHLKLMGAYRWLPIAIEAKRRVLSVIRRRSQVSGPSPETPTT